MLERLYFSRADVSIMTGLSQRSIMRHPERFPFIRVGRKCLYPAGIVKNLAELSNKKIVQTGGQNADKNV
jgi:hypothetical protein